MSRHTPSKPPPLQHTKTSTGEPDCWVWNKKRAEWVCPVEAWTPGYSIQLPSRKDALEALKALRRTDRRG